MDTERERERLSDRNRRKERESTPTGPIAGQADVETNSVELRARGQPAQKAGERKREIWRVDR